ncbi:MAG: hypothetical protein ABNH00_02080 [Dokdonia sp.]|jgi:hypothetical protein
MKKYLFLVATLWCTVLWAQHSERLLSDSLVWDTHSYISFDLSSPLLLGETSRYNIGYIHHLKDRWKVGAHLGYGNEDINLNESEEDYRFFEVRPTLYYFTNPERNAPIYYGLELYYVNQQETRLSGEFLPEDGGVLQNYDRAQFQREKYGLNFTFGVITNITNRLKINFFYGMGPRIRQNSYTNIVNQRPAQFEDEDGWIVSGSRFEGYALGLDINAGIKLFYRMDN